MDSDSDENISNAFTYNFKNMDVSVKGPNLSTFTNNNMMGAMQMTRDFMQDKRSVYDQRSIISRRELSSRSIRSGSNFQPRNYMFSHDLHGVGSESVCSIQSRNPMGLTNFVTAIDIALSLQYNQFNENDMKIINKAYKEFIKRFQTPYSDSGDQGDDLSLSIDDNDGDNSLRSSVFNENMPSYRSTKAFSTSSRMSRQKSVYKRYPANFRKCTSRNTCVPNFKDNLPNHSQIGENVKTLQKNRFQSRYLLPSQRFNKSIAAHPITENISKVQPTVQCDGNIGQKNDDSNAIPSISSEIDNERILSEATINKNVNKKEQSSKRKLEEDHCTTIPSKKRAKLSPIQKIPNDNLKSNQHTKAVNKDETSGFCFIKPSFPIRKLSNKSKIQETFNDNSAQTLVVSSSQLNISPGVEDESMNKDTCEPIINSTSDLSNRPSFIKRKLFTQTLDVTENKNTSCVDSVHSPIVVSNSIQKEKNKPRKLGSNLACLDRDVTEETSLIPLIQKIVPLSQINSTTESNKAVGSNKEDVRKEWDVASVISECHAAGGSDTYTDEDIFELNATNCTKDNNLKTNDRNKKSAKNCQVVLKKQDLANSSSNSKLTTKFLLAKESAANKQKDSESKGNEVKSKIFRDTFWESDFESDFECQNMQKKFPEYPRKDKVSSENLKEKEELIRTEQLTKTTDANNRTPNNSDMSVKSNIKRLNEINSRIRSHRAPKKIKCCTESEISSNKGADINVKLNSQHKDNNVAKNIINNRQTENIEDSGNKGIVIKQSSQARIDVQIGKKRKQTNGNTGKLTKTTPAKTKSKKDSKSNESDTLHSMKLSPSNNKSKTRKGQIKENKITNRRINIQESESDISFSLLDISVRTRSRTKAIVGLMNNSNVSK